MPNQIPKAQTIEWKDHSSSPGQTGDAWPSFVQEEIESPTRFRRTWTSSLNDLDAKLRIGRSKWQPVRDRCDGLRVREYFAWVEVLGERRCAICMWEFEGCASLSGWTFYDIMDASSAYEPLGANIVLAWEDVGRDLFLFGSILDVQLGCANSADLELCARAAKALIGEVCPNYSVMVVDAPGMPWDDPEGNPSPINPQKSANEVCRRELDTHWVLDDGMLCGANPMCLPCIKPPSRR